MMLGVADEAVRLVALAPVLVEEVADGQEEVAVQAGVGELAVGLDRGSAVAVGQGHLGPHHADLHPLGVGQVVPVGQHDRLRFRVDLDGVLPVPPERGVVQPGIDRGHLGRHAIEELLDDVPGDVGVDQPRPKSVPELVGGDLDGPAVLVGQAARLPARLGCARRGRRAEDKERTRRPSWDQYLLTAQTREEFEGLEAFIVDAP
ncbi:hypothetical protein H4W81_001621 [Nonomuraea africana]|uniref:Uncharacterized protein n=1 Tax=Nonomuraea africana TaxID=46171 RepID=A0ABR9KA04_9ACTN|nr:hypothetical protein [Nonomuraea africana]MBE1558842.1 hypothetical protein [Nonomuraea africana]